MAPFCIKKNISLNLILENSVSFINADILWNNKPMIWKIARGEMEMHFMFTKKKRGKLYSCMDILYILCQLSNGMKIRPRYLNKIFPTNKCPDWRFI